MLLIDEIRAWERAGTVVLGIAAYSGTGKTSLLTRLLPLLKAQGLRIGVIKHAHHDFELDYPGKDSYELRQAGADQMLVGSRRQWALVGRCESAEEPDLRVLMSRLERAWLDLVLVEGFKHEAFPKLEIHRPSLAHAPLYPHDPYVVALGTDCPPTEDPGIPVLDLNDVSAVAKFVYEYVASVKASSRP